MTVLAQFRPQEPSRRERWAGILHRRRRAPEPGCARAKARAELQRALSALAEAHSVVWRVERDPGRPHMGRVRVGGAMLELTECGSGDLDRLVDAKGREALDGGGVRLVGARHLWEPATFMFSFSSLRGQKVLVPAMVSRIVQEGLAGPA